VYDDQGRLIVILLSEGQMRDYEGAALMLNALPPAKQLLGAKDDDAHWLPQGARGPAA
jgi:hypothetical protein